MGAPIRTLGAVPVPAPPAHGARVLDVEGYKALVASTLRALEVSESGWVGSAEDFHELPRSQTAAKQRALRLKKAMEKYGPSGQRYEYRAWKASETRWHWAIRRVV